MIDKNANQLVSENYKSYARYVLETRALPSVEDGLKLAQRRIIYAASMQPQKLIKTASLAGKVMEYHPHGDCSGTIYSLTHPLNSQRIFNIKGNHGGYGFAPSASRYTELYLNDVGRYNYCQFIEYAEYCDGELGTPEPVSLPCLIPYTIISGADGMGVGLSTDIIPLNFIDVIKCYKKFIKEGKYDPSIVKPDPGPFILEGDQDWITSVVHNSKSGTLTTNPVLVKESHNVVVSGRFPRGIDHVLSKTADWIDGEFVDYINESSGNEERYVFRIMNDKKGELTAERLMEHLNWHGRTRRSYTRCMVDSDKSAIYCSLKYAMEKSLETLNKAIDKWLALEKVKTAKKLELYQALERAKALHIFDDIAKKSTDEVVASMVKIGIEESLAKEIIRKPISYLTREHDNEMQDLKNRLKELEDHDRTKFLLDMYDKFESMVWNDHHSRKHAIRQSDIISRPRIKLENNKIEIFPTHKGKNQGYELGDKTYLITDTGKLYIRSFQSPTRTTIELDFPEKIVGLVTDKCKYLEIVTKHDKRGVSYETSSLTGERNLVNLDSGESVSYVIGWGGDAPSRVTRNIVKKISGTRWY